MERKDIAQQDQWDLSELFESDEKWEEAFAAVEKKVDFSAFCGKLNCAENILAYFKAEEELSKEAMKVYLYAFLNHDLDVKEPKYNGYMARVSNLFTKLSAETSFASPEISRLSDETLLGFAEEERFAPYDYMLRRMVAEKKHILSEAEEKIIAQAGEITGIASDVFEMLDNAELNLPEIEWQGKLTPMSHGLYSVIINSGDRSKREEAFRLYYSAYEKIVNTLATTYYGNVKENMFYKKVRKYGSCLEKALFAEDVERSVYDNLIACVGEGTPILHRYIAARKKVLGYPELHMYDLFVPLVENADLRLPFEEAFELVVKGLSPLGKEYESLLRRAKAERWMDVYETPGKRSGAYSIGVYGEHPYVLLNYQQTTHDVFTIAHELGHSMHSVFSNQSQPYAKSDYKIFVAEVASTVNEVLLLKYLLKTSKDPALKKYLLTYFMDMIRTTLFRQTQFAEFEQKAHDMAESGIPLNKDNLSEIYYELNRRYYGEAICHDEQIAIEWARIPHFYRSFYVYKYATGIISAITIANKILSEGEPAVEKYFEFLSGGSMTDPVSLLKIAGADLTTQAPFRTAMAEFADALERFEALIG